MQHVKTQWLRIFNYGLATTSCALFVVFLLFEHFSVSGAVKGAWGITPSILTIALIHALFVVITDRLLIKRSPWLVSVISLTIYGILLVSIIESSGNTNIFYRGVLALLLFLSGMLGIYPPITALILIWMVLGFTVSGILAPTNASLTFNIVVDTIVTITGLGGWLFFRRYYEIGSDKATRRLVETIAVEKFKSNLILESITDGVLIIAPKGTVQVLNESAARMLGWDREEATGLDYRSLFEVEEAQNPKESGEDAITMTLNAKTSNQKISLVKTVHQQQTYIDIVASPIMENTPGNTLTPQIMTGIVAVLRDVDEQKRQEQQRSDFISTASHEMRTPVASIQGFIELSLNPKVATIDDKARGYLIKAQTATKHLGELFQDLLTVSKSDDGRLVNNPKVIEINGFLKEVIDENKLSAEKKNLQVVLEPDQSKEKTVAPLLYINADPDRLREVISNLFDNAVKYTATGMVTVGASLKGQGVIIRISDTGMGIAEEDISHLFQKFYRTDNTATREIGGTGLGLYICKEIIQMMGGKIYVESTLGAGSTFFVELPRVTNETIQKTQP